MKTRLIAAIMVLISLWSVSAPLVLAAIDSHRQADSGVENAHLLPA